MIEGIEILVAVSVIAVLFFLVPKKMPELARSLGLARKEFKKAMKDE